MAQGGVGTSAVDAGEGSAGRRVRRVGARDRDRHWTVLRPLRSRDQHLTSVAQPGDPRTALGPERATDRWAVPQIAALACGAGNLRAGVSRGGAEDCRTA